MSDGRTTPRHVSSPGLPANAPAPAPVSPTAVPVALSTASVYPEGVAAGFEIAAELGYDGVELMIWTDPVSQDPRAVERLAHRYGVPVLAVHAPCLAVTQRVWGADPVHRLRRTVEGLAGNFTVCPPALPQHAALAAFDETSYAEADAHVVRYGRNRDLLLSGLPEIGIDRLAPADGAFYVYADIAHLLRDGEYSMGLTYRLLAETGIAVAPGPDFDPVDGGGYVRFSCAGEPDGISAALERLRAWV